MKHLEQKMSGRIERGINRAMLNAAFETLCERGLDCFRAPHEAEEECAAMCIQGRADWTVTEDIDALTFGAPVVLRGITTQSPTLVTLDAVLAGLLLTTD